MAKRGTPVTRIADGKVAADAAAVAASALGDGNGGEADAEASLVVDKLDGITDDQAQRIREAVAANKRRKRQQG